MMSELVGNISSSLPGRLNLKHKGLRSVINTVPLALVPTRATFHPNDLPPPSFRRTGCRTK